MRILAIETSCDETALAIIETEGSSAEKNSGQALDSNAHTPTEKVAYRQSLGTVNFRVRANNIVSQIAIHKEYGGVFPMLAKREHARALVPLLVKTLTDAGLYKKTSRHVIEHPLRPDFQEILLREPELFAQFISVLPEIDPPVFDAIAVTSGPGLEPALWVGINFAKALSLIWKAPVVPINHMEGHILTALIKKTDDAVYTLEKTAFPILGLLVSGGHTELVLSREFGKYELVGETKDDAAGEAFDKVARMLGLPYPGGPEIANLALRGHSGIYKLPRPMLGSGDYAFSFSGLKTAVLYLVKNIGELSDVQKADIAREFEDACVEVLVAKTISAAEEFDVRTIVVGGGVSANRRLREELHKCVEHELGDVELYIPEPSLATDNALMVAVAAMSKGDAAIPIADIRANGNWRLA